MSLFKIAGIRVGANWTWLLALGYLIVMLSGDYKAMLGSQREAAAFAFAVAMSFAFFGSIILHEFGHAIVARRNSIGILGIDLWILGGVAKLDRDPATPGVEFRVAAGGPFVTLLIAAACLGTAFALDAEQSGRLVRLTSDSGDDAWIASLVWLGVVNAFLLAFNLIPAYPLDGGRIARAIAWRLTGSRQRATSIASVLGRAFGFLLIGLGVLMLGAGLLFNGAMFIFMGMTLSQAARAAVSQNSAMSAAAGLKASDVMDGRPVTMPADATADRALEEYFWRYRWPWFPVTEPDGRFLGLIEQHSVELIDEAERPGRGIRDLIVPESAGKVAIAADTPLTALLANDQMQSYGALMAVDSDGILCGVVTIEQVQRSLREAIERAARQRSDGPPDRQ